MRVAMVSPYDLGVPGGVQSHVIHLAAALRALGDEVVVIAPGDGRPGPAAHAATGRSIGVPFNGSVAPIGLGPAAIVRTRRYLAEVRPDIVHVHEPLVPAVGLTAARTRLAPVVGTFHAWSSDVRAYRALRPIGRRVLGGLAAAVAVSRAAAEYHAAALGVPEGRFQVVPNGVDATRFASADGRDHDTRPSGRSPTARLLFVGRLEPRKGLVTLVQAYVALRADHPDLILDVVGEGPELAAARRLLTPELRSGVRFHGRVTDEELVAFYAGADLYVSPALGGESFGIVLLEAMAAGRAVVASDIPGYRSVVTPDHDAVLVPPGDAAALARAIAVLLDDPDRRHALATAGSRTAAAHDWPVVAGRIRAIYERLLAS